MKFPDKNGKMVEGNFSQFEKSLDSVLKHGYGSPAKPKSSGLTFAAAQKKLRNEAGIDLQPAPTALRDPDPDTPAQQKQSNLGPKQVRRTFGATGSAKRVTQ